MVPETVPESVPGTVPESVPGTVPESVPGTVPGTVPELTLQVPLDSQRSLLSFFADSTK
jgi:hypothetical protein